MNRLMQLLMLSLALTLTAGGLSDAHAKKKRQSSRSAPIRNIGIKSFDRVFKEARTVDNKLRDGQRRRRTARQQVARAVGLKSQARFPASLKQLQSRAKNQVRLAASGNQPRLNAASAAPSSVKSAVTAVNVAVKDYSSLLRDLVGLPADCTRLVKQISNFNTARLKRELSQLSVLNVSKRVQQVKTFRNNVRTINQMPGKASRLIQGLRADVNAVSSVFPSR